MMISPGSFYDEVKDKNAEEIESEIRKLKRTISRLKREIEDPLEEWRNDYSPERYGMFILDGTQWSLKLKYEDGKVREYAGDNVYPWNFGELCRLFGFEWNRYN